MAKPSANEGIKDRSDFLRGTIADGLNNAITGAIADDDAQLTKFHGIYLQDDRDLRPERAKKKLERAYAFMARLRVPGGILTPAQWLAMERIAIERANRTLRLTTRQTIQFHGVIKTNLKPAIQAIGAAMLDTFAACGDVNRNVVAALAPQHPVLQAELAVLARGISQHLLPQSRAYHEVWLDGEKLEGGEQEDEPILGRLYLPRKFKIGLAVPPVNDVDVFAQDLGLIAIIENGEIAGWNVAVGGGMGMTHGEPDTFPRTGDVIGFCTTAQAIDVAEKIVTIQRDWGDRSDRKHARLKYTIERAGLAAFRTELDIRLGYALAPARPFAFARSGDASGWQRGEDGAWHFTLFVENGRIVDRAAYRLLSGLHAIAEIHRGEFILTPNQNLVIANVSDAAKPAIDALLAEYGIAALPRALRRNAMACVALPTCGLAVAESERYLPDLITALEAELDRFGLGEDEITIRMTGCPNGCARPYLAEIGLVGRNPGVYNLYLGGAFDGARLNKLYRRDVRHDEIIAALAPLFGAYAAGRQDGEHFSDFLIRTGIIQPTTAGNRFHADLMPDLAA